MNDPANSIFQPKQFTARHRGFTLVELLVVVAMLALLAAVMLPALAKTKPSNHVLVCQNNLKQLMSAVHLYAADNRDWLPPNEDIGSSANWVTGSMTSTTDPTNTSLLIQAQTAKLAPFTGPAADLYHCPADTSTVSIASRNYLRVRSVSMNGAVGTKVSVQTAVDGPWLDGSHTHVANTPWRTYGRLADVIAPGPALLWVIADEDPLSINDNVLAMSMASPEWIDFPATYHNFGGSLVFADGHAEIRKWREPSTKCPNPATLVNVPAGHTGDITWLQARTSARYH